ncbi:uncharacterized protein KY384_000776 [Bacidia gigantensis]|uniref:uncharacterized protein n=1 Tax=Bacidia gigantensis TaxID=2732470 RepID=UPI001D052369|nr:uncharacterized protein KY384_000776 [Bacidia gigantensis]KAG8526014.1 hypothetical protein KY384_000776 [Bacidia gigantensis]
MDTLPTELHKAIFDNLGNDLEELFRIRYHIRHSRELVKENQNKIFGVFSTLLNLSLTNSYYEYLATPILKFYLAAMLKEVKLAPWAWRKQHRSIKPTRSNGFYRYLLWNYVDSIAYLDRRFRPWAVRMTAPEYPHRVTVMAKRPGRSGMEGFPLELMTILYILKRLNSKILRTRYHGDTNEIEIATKDMADRMALIERGTNDKLLNFRQMDRAMEADKENDFRNVLTIFRKAVGLEI